MARVRHRVRDECGGVCDPGRAREVDHRVRVVLLRTGLGIGEEGVDAVDSGKLHTRLVGEDIAAADELREALGKTRDCGRMRVRLTQRSCHDCATAGRSSCAMRLDSVALLGASVGKAEDVALAKVAVAVVVMLLAVLDATGSATDEDPDEERVVNDVKDAADDVRTEDVGSALPEASAKQAGGTSGISNEIEVAEG